MSKKEASKIHKQAIAAAAKLAVAAGQKDLSKQIRAIKMEWAETPQFIEIKEYSDMKL